MKTCKYCNKKIENKRNKIFCNRFCSGKYLGEHTPKRRNPVIYCLYCGKELTQQQTRTWHNGVRQKYCSTSCQMNYEYKVGIRNGQQITEKAHQTLREKGHYKRNNAYLVEKNPARTKIARLKISNSKKGFKNPMFNKKPWNYKDDGLLKNRYIKRKEWLRIKKLILIRDNFTCQACKITQEQSYQIYNQPLQVHHLIPYRICKEHKINNLITLCCRCHSKVTQIEQKKLTIRFVRGE